jgi:hypothetical protein
MMARAPKNLAPVEQLEPLNPALRDHVNRYAFVLSLRPTHISSLVYVERMTRLEPPGPRLTDAQQARNRAQPNRHDHRMAGDPDVRFMARLDSNFVAGVRGLLSRGLVVHETHERDPWKPNNERPFGDFYQITSAGRHVIGLLKGSGLWQAYLKSMPWIDDAERRAA